MNINIKDIEKKIKLLSKDTNNNYYELLNIYKDLIIKYYSIKYN
jgi:hypothetical protein